jgi:peptidoglycan hydrolase-like protein with peptidoglycan-binding domain
MIGKITSLVCTLALVPALAFAQQTTPTPPMHDTTTRMDTATKTTQDTSYGKLGSPLQTAKNPGLTSDQVKQLQKAINSNGCDAGSADGTWSAKTEQGVQCVRQQKNITSTDINDVLKALNLSFTVKSDSSSMPHDTSSH